MPDSVLKFNFNFASTASARAVLAPRHRHDARAPRVLCRSEFRDDVARALEALDAKRVSWDEFRSAALGDEDGEGDRERQLADENAELKRRLARASGDGLGGQQWGSMAGGDDDDSYSSRSSRSYSSRSGDSLYDEFEDFQ